MTFEQAFSKIKEKFDKADAKGIADFAVQVTLTDEDCGGTFYAEVKNGKLNVEPYDYYDNNAVLNISKSALLALLSGRVSLDKSIANGDAYVQGDASKIADWKKTIKNSSAKKTTAKKIAKTAKKAPAKKAAPKKTAVKKAAEKKTVEKKASEKKADTKPVTKTAVTATAPKASAPAKTTAVKTEKKN